MQAESPGTENDRAGRISPQGNNVKIENGVKSTGSGSGAPAKPAGAVEPARLARFSGSHPNDAILDEIRRDHRSPLAIAVLRDGRDARSLYVSSESEPAVQPYSE